MRHVGKMLNRVSLMLHDSSDRFRALALHGQHHAFLPSVVRVHVYTQLHKLADLRSRGSPAFSVVIPESRGIERINSCL